MSDNDRDRELGMGRGITRRDFLNGVSMADGTSLVGGNSTWLEAFGVPQSPFAPEKDSSYYPPAKTGLRGTHDGAWEVDHDMRDGNDKGWAEPVDDGKSYDLIVVGAGISGLASAYFYRKFAGQQSKILVLDNHDDFGGHAKRNEFYAGERLLLGYGGTQSIEAPGHYSKEATGLLKELGIAVKRFFKYHHQELLTSMHLTDAALFDKETFGSHRPREQKGPHHFGLHRRFD